MEGPGRKYWSISHALPCGVPALLTCDSQPIVAVFMNKGKRLRPVDHMVYEEMCQRSFLICQAIAKADTIAGDQDLEFFWLYIAHRRS